MCLCVLFKEIENTGRLKGFHQVHDGKNCFTSANDFSSGEIGRLVEFVFTIIYSRCR